MFFLGKWPSFNGWLKSFNLWGNVSIASNWRTSFFSFKRGIYLVTLLEILVLPDMLGVADQKAHILAPRKQRRVNADENILPSARAQE